MRLKFFKQHFSIKVSNRPGNSWLALSRTYLRRRHEFLGESSPWRPRATLRPEREPGRRASVIKIASRPFPALRNIFQLEFPLSIFFSSAKEDARTILFATELTYDGLQRGNVLHSAADISKLLSSRCYSSSSSFHYLFRQTGVDSPRYKNNILRVARDISNKLIAHGENGLAGLTTRQRTEQTRVG